MIRLATYNLENLFTRPSAMNRADDDEGRQAIEDHAEANRIIDQEIYGTEEKRQLIELSEKYGWHLLKPPEEALVKLQKIRGQLFRKPEDGQLEVVASGRTAWIGWFELQREDIAWTATYNTGHVIKETGADILITIEVEDRPTLSRFNQQVLRAQLECEYPHFMVIDGNDERGIDVGILSRYPIVEIRSHVDDPLPDGRSVFSRDCPEFDIMLPGDRRIVIIPNHFKSKRNGNNQTSRDHRRAQAKRAHEIASATLHRSALLLIGGDLNDTPDSWPLAPLFADGFEDVIRHPNYPQDRPGTYQTGLASQKLDYLIMAPALRLRLRNTGIERRGSYHPRTWEPFDTVQSTEDEASDHHLVWADFDL